MKNKFLPICKKDMDERGIQQLDFVYVIGDAYVDHPSFGHAIISRVLEAHGYTVGIISQPDWKDDHSISILGEPRLGFLVAAGNMDSMVNHYTVSKKRRSTDEERFPSVQGAPAGSAHAGKRNIQSRHRSPENTAPCAGRAAAGRPFHSGHWP